MLLLGEMSIISSTRKNLKIWSGDKDRILLLNWNNEYDEEDICDEEEEYDVICVIYDMKLGRTLVSLALTDHSSAPPWVCLAFDEHDDNDDDYNDDDDDDDDDKDDSDDDYLDWQRIPQRPPSVCLTVG